jgi:hypothetical protein
VIESKEAESGKEDGDNREKKGKKGIGEEEWKN